MLAILIFIVILGLLIFVHELGHFMVARRNGIRAEEFGFGFPPRIVGIQFLKGKERKKFSEIESLEVERLDIKEGQEEIIKETITERVHNVSRSVPVKKWRIIWGSRDGDDENEKEDLSEAHKKRYAGNTIYSLNWILLGGFVRIKGENGENRDSDSFAVKNAWTRVKVLAAGVSMNFVLAWVLISLAFAIGAPEAVDSSAQAVPNLKIQISEVLPASPAEISGIKIGDEVLKDQIDSAGHPIHLERVKNVQEYINSQKGRQITLKIKRGADLLNLKMTPRADAPEGKGPLGVALSETALVRYPWYEAIWKGLVSTLELIVAILVAFGGILKGLFMGQGAPADISGPVGIAVLTKQVASLGFVYILQFAALLSINLGIINILPIPALDGGRILFVLIEKLKGKPVSQKTEQMIHTVGFILLITLMILVTFKDVARFVK